MTWDEFVHQFTATDAKTAAVFLVIAVLGALAAKAPAALRLSWRLSSSGYRRLVRRRPVELSPRAQALLVLLVPGEHWDDDMARAIPGVKNGRLELSDPRTQAVYLKASGQDATVGFTTAERRAVLAAATECLDAQKRFVADRKVMGSSPNRSTDVLTAAEAAAASAHVWERVPPAEPFAPGLLEFMQLSDADVLHRLFVDVPKPYPSSVGDDYAHYVAVQFTVAGFARTRLVYIGRFVSSSPLTLRLRIIGECTQSFSVRSIVTCTTWR